MLGGMSYRECIMRGIWECAYPDTLYFYSHYRPHYAN